MELAGLDSRIIRDLKRLLYSPDNLQRYRACDMMGKAAGVIAHDDPGSISKLMQGLFTAVTDSAASSWGYITAIGEIIANRPDQFGGYAPQLFPLAADRILLPDVLRAFVKIADHRPDILRKKAYQFIPLLQDPKPDIRGNAAVLLGILGATEAKDDLLGMKGDDSQLDIYHDGQLAARTVGNLASEAFAKL